MKLMLWLALIAISTVMFAFLILRDLLGDIFLKGARQRRMDKMIEEAKAEAAERERRPGQ